MISLAASRERECGRLIAPSLGAMAEQRRRQISMLQA